MQIKDKRDVYPVQLDISNFNLVYTSVSANYKKNDNLNIKSL
jgi:hypothetical protein